METHQPNARDYSNLATYKSHPPPHYGKGINAPYFGASPMRSSFKRGDIATNIVFHTECCDNYAVSGQNTYINQKMLRQKKI